ncbi:MAG: polysaccharide deacetylase family protein [Solirubrobacterales bacterium]
MRIYYIEKKTLKRCGWAVLVLFILGIGVAGLYQVQSARSKSVLAPFYQGVTHQKNVALTFNVDWGEENVPQLLKVLKENDVKATFFITGQWAAKNQETARMIASEGHEVANHGDRHRHVQSLSPEMIKTEILDAEAKLKQITGKKTRLYAPAYGEYDQKIGNAAAELGYQVILWSIDTIDWQKPDPNTIAQRVLPRIHNDAIILMHPTQPTVASLPGIVKTLRAEGYGFLPVSQIIKPAVKTKKTVRPGVTAKTSYSVLPNRGGLQ